MKTSKVENKSLFQGRNEYETGILTIPAGETVSVGAFLARGADGKFTAVSDTATEKPVAVNPVEMKNTGVASADFSFRALIGGKVRFDMLSVGGQPITAAQADMIRQYGIIPKNVTNVSWTE